MRRVVQIVGKITGDSSSENVKKFQRAENELRNAGYEVINPLSICAPVVESNPGRTDEEIWDECMEVTLKSIRTKADAICLLTDVMSSRGSRVEIAEALKHGKIVSSLNFLTL